MAGASPALHKVRSCWPVLFRADVSSADAVIKGPGRVTQSDHKTGETAEYEQNCCTEHCPSSHGGHFVYCNIDTTIADSWLLRLFWDLQWVSSEGGAVRAEKHALIHFFLRTCWYSSGAETKIKRTVPFSYRSVVSSLQCAVAAARLPYYYMKTT